jgi:glycosyltransferase involved in cell wall biosynthesis
MELCPHLADEVQSGCARSDAFAVLHGEHARRLRKTLGVDPEIVHQVGAGYRDDLFHARDREEDLPPTLLYVGKYSRSKGLPWLIDAFERLARRRPGLTLQVAGSGTGSEAESLRARLDRLAPAVVQHGQLGQGEVAQLARRSTVCVLPSFYEGLPLVLVEAMACGNRLVATALPGIVEELAPRLGEALTLIEPPRLEKVDQPIAVDLPVFVDALEAAIETALDAPLLEDPATTRPETLAPFTWGAVFERVEAIWRSLG